MTMVLGILRKTIRGLGLVGTIQKIALGRFTYLLREGHVEYATPESIEALESSKLTLQKEDNIRKEEAQRHLLLLENYHTTIDMESNEKGILYGAVSSRVIAKHLEKALGFSLESEQIRLRDAIRTVGTHEVVVELYPGIEGRIKLEIVSSHGSQGFQKGFQQGSHHAG